MVTPFTTIAVVGSGFMGAQIGLHCAAHGYAVWCYDPSEASLQRAADRHSEELRRRLDLAQIDVERADATRSRIHFTQDLATALSKAELVIEAAPEDLRLKRELFAEMDRRCSPEAILATNSSSIPISTIEDVTSRPDRLLNTHFYPPPWRRSMVELMRGTATSDQTMALAVEFARSLDLTPILVQRESRGFVFNRVWRAIKKECLHVVDEGVATAEDVDRAWMICMGTTIGPFGLMDMVGLDVVRDIEMEYYRASGDASDAPPRLLLDKIERGELGIKTGQGFYTYPHPAYADPTWLRRGGVA